MYEIGKDILLEKRYIQRKKFEQEFKNLMDKQEKRKKKFNKKQKLEKTKEDLKNASLLLIFAALLGVASVGEPTQKDIETQETYTQELIQQYEQEQNKETAAKMITEERNEDRIAFYIQNAGIKENGSITKPEFFKYIPNEYKDMIILIKDTQIDQLKSYMKRKIQPENKIIFEAEVMHKKDALRNSVLTYQFNQR